MKHVHPEFSFQSRELEGQIEGTLGDPPNRKNYDMMVGALVAEYAGGSGLDDVNLMAFALVDKIRFKDPKGLMREAADYEGGDPARVFAMAECGGEDGQAMYASMTANHPELARQAIITAFLYKNQGRWDDIDQSLDQLAEGDDGDEDDEMDSTAATDDFTQLFDPEGGERE
ncbi:hypothetical protein B0920_11680 [Massilia sp. KIM]|jgi:hypothetical protein|uniref:hypothetical protein n=1 Tax=Massilia sp. KIM TaxID=1955422 RepID=UPI00098F067C|nr:hypothetical protein [Massilia sp. KIM]OON63970.1 hypothetical protein B0920_11680 [Massilia sp. KIM]